MSIGAPTQRWSHVAAWDGTFLWLHGGWSSTGSLRELWKFDPLLTLWSLLSDAGPAARHDHVATYDEIDHSLLVHGGWDGDQVFGDLWKFQERLRRWSRVSESVEARPTARFDHAAAYDAQRRTWWLHGGGNGVEGFTDLWALDVPTLQWTQVARGSGPSTWDHVCAWDPVGRALWIHGGWGSDDLWKFDVEANHWSIQERGGSPRWDHVAALDTHGPNGPMLYIHGGRDSNNRPYPGLVEFQLQPTMDCLMPGQLLSMGGSWTCPVAAITFISVLVLMAFAMCTASCTDWRLRSQRLHGGDGARTKAASLGCLGRCVNELLRHVQAIQLRVLPGDLQTVMESVDAKGRVPEEWQKELSDQNLRLKYNELTDNFLQRGCFIFLWRWMILFLSIHPWVRACCLSFSISHLARVASNVSSSLTFPAALVAVAYAARPWEECAPSSVLQKVFLGVWIALVSLLPGYLLWLPRCFAKGICILLCQCIFWFLLLVYLVFCLFLTLSFLSTAPLPDAHAWLVTWVLAVIQALLIIPMLAAFGLCMFVGVYLRCDPAGAEEIKKLRQIIMEPPPVVSIWDGDIMDDTYGAHGSRCGFSVPRPRVDETDPEVDEMPLSPRMVTIEEGIQTEEEPRWLVCCSQPKPQRAAPHLVRLHFAARSR